MRAGAVLLVCCILICPLQSYAGAWLQPVGAWQINHDVYFYSTRKSFDIYGDRVSQQKYRKTDYRPYIEYGVTNDWTVGVKPSIQLVKQDGQGSRFGVAEAEVFAKTPLWQGESTIISAQGAVKFPVQQDNDRTPSLGQRQVDVEGRLMVGHTFNFLSNKDYIDLSLAYRTRFGVPLDQLMVEASLGVYPVGDWQLLAQIFDSAAVGSSSSRALVLSNSQDYDLSKLQLSVVKPIKDNVSIQLGAFTHWRGKNTGAGGGWLLSLWTRF